MRFSPSTLGWYPEFIDYPNPPGDLIEVSDALYAELVGKQIEEGPDGAPREYVAPPPTSEETVVRLVAALQSRMDSQARLYGYDDLKTAITYRGDPNPKFASEAEAFFLWRSATWTTAYAILAEVEAGTRPLPTLEEAAALLSPLVLEAA